MGKTRKSPWNTRQINDYQRRYGYGKTVVRVLKDSGKLPARLKPKTFSDWMQIVVVAPEGTEIHEWAAKNYARIARRICRDKTKK